MSGRGYLVACASFALLACDADPGYGGRSSRDWIRALTDTSAVVRMEAAYALGKVLEIQPRSPKVVQALIETLADTVDDVRMAAATALVAEGVRAEGAIPGVHLALHDSAHASVRAHAALILGSLGTGAGQEAVTGLTEALDDPDPQVRSAAAEALGKVGQEATASVPALQSHLADTTSNVRLKVLEALFNIRAPDSVTVPAFRNGLSDSAESVRAAAAYMLGGLRAAAEPALEALVVALSDPEPAVRAAGAFAVAQIGPAARSALPQLRRLLQDSDQRVRQFAEDAIVRIEHPEQVPER